MSGVGEKSYPSDGSHAIADQSMGTATILFPQARAIAYVSCFYIKPMWFLENSVSAEYALNFGAPTVRMTPKIVECVKRLTGLLLDDESRDHFDHWLFETTRICFEQSWQDDNLLTPLLRARRRFTDFRVRSFAQSDAGPFVR